MMFGLIKQVVIAVLSFSGSLATKCMPLNNEKCMIKATLIDLNPVEFKYYQLMISFNTTNFWLV